MKRYIITLLTSVTILTSANGMSYSRAREEALYLTDKMAYELNLNSQQYDDAYEINLDYFLSMNNERDLYAEYLSYRLTDLRCILYDWQYNLMMASHYFVRPILWRAGCWHFPIYAYYGHGHFYYHRPTVYVSYRGGHGHSHYHSGFYASRRPEWNGGFRGHDMSHPGRPAGRVDGKVYHFRLPDTSHGNQGSAAAVGDVRPGRGNGNHAPYNGQPSGGRGNSFGSSSSRVGSSSPSSSRGSSSPMVRGSSSSSSRGSSSPMVRGASPSSSRGSSSPMVRGTSSSSSRGAMGGTRVSRGGTTTSHGNQVHGGSRGSR